MAKRPDMRVTFGSLTLPGPVALASGTCGYGEEMKPFLSLDCLGAIVLKGVTLNPRAGNPPPRVAETPSGLLNSIGLQNPGLQVFVDEVLPRIRNLGPPLIANVSGRDPEEYEAMVERLGPETGLAAVEVNVSCPNRTGESIIGTDPQATAEVVETARRCARLPIIVKLTPEAGPLLLPVARAASKAGAQGLTIANTFRGMAIDVESGATVLAAGIGGLSGPAIRPLALRMVYEVSQAVSLPIFGCGGICSASDALEFLRAGATAVQVGSASMVDPRCGQHIHEGMEAFLKAKGLASPGDLVGSVTVSSRGSSSRERSAGAKEAS